MIDPAIAGMARATLALIFLASGFGKARNLRWFAGVLHDYGIVPASLVWPLAVAIPAAEIFAALGLLAAALSALSAAVLIVLLAGFSLAIGSNLARGRRDIDCGCLGPAAQRSALSAWLIVRNLALLALAAVPLAPVLVREIVWIDFLTVGLGTLTLLFLFSAINRLVAQAPAIADLRHHPEELR